MFCRAGHCFSSLMWFVPSSQGRRIDLELTAHEFVIRAPVMQASLLQSSACVRAARLPVEHTLPGCLHPGRGRGSDTGKGGVVGDPYRRAKQLQWPSSCSPCVFLGLQGHNLAQLRCVAAMVKDCVAFCSDTNP